MLGLTSNAYVLDLETVGLIHLNKVSEVVCWSIYCDDFERFGWEIDSLREAYAQLTSEGYKPVFHNASFDVSIMRGHGINVLDWEDTMLMSYVSCTSNRHSLSAWGEFLKCPKLETPQWLKASKRKKGVAPTLLPMYVDYTEEMKAETEEYCKQDTVTTWELLKYFDENMDRATHSIYLRDKMYTSVVLDMEHTGCHLNMEELQDMKEELATESDKLHKEMVEIVGLVESTPLIYKKPHDDLELLEKRPRSDGKDGFEYLYENLVEFNPNSNQQLATYLQSLGWKPQEISEKSGEPKLDDAVLSNLTHIYPIAAFKKDYAEISKVLNTYLIPFAEEYTDKHNIIRPSFNQCVTRTGRLSSSRPNFQNIPAKREDGDLGERMRSLICTPSDDFVLLGGDLSNIEARLFAYYLHLYGSSDMAEAFQKGQDFHQVNADKWGVTRKLAKKILYLTLYGGGAQGLSTQAGIPLNEAKDINARFHKAVPELKLINSDAIKEIERHGYVTTLFGRRVHYDYPELGSSKRAKGLRARVERQAGNCLFQTAAGDILKLLSLRSAPYVWKANAHFIVQAHDEVLIQCPKDKAEELKASLESIFNQDAESSWVAPVPIVAEFKIGSTWNDTH